MLWRLLTPPFETIQLIVVIQFIFIGVHFLAAFALGPIQIFFRKRKEWHLDLLQRVLRQTLELKDPTPPPLSPFLSSIPILAPMIRRIDSETTDPLWPSLRNSLIEAFLLPQAQHDAYSRRWTHRMHAIGAFLLSPDVRYEPHILHLLHDPVPLVQYTAATCAAKLGTPESTNALIDAMNRSDRFLRHPYREAFMKGNPRSFTHLEAQLERDKDPLSRVSCLEVLATRMNPHIADLAERDLYAPQKNLRIAAIRALGHFPDPKSITSLIPLLKDPEWEVRALAARSLGYLRAPEALSALIPLLSDSVWWVRLNGALALKRLGEEGKQILKRQGPQEGQLASDIAHYVLHLSHYE